MTSFGQGLAEPLAAEGAAGSRGSVALRRRHPGRMDRPRGLTRANTAPAREQVDAAHLAARSRGIAAARSRPLGRGLMALGRGLMALGAAALRGGVKQGLFPRGAGARPFGEQIRSVPERLGTPADTRCRTPRAAGLKRRSRLLDACR